MKHPVKTLAALAILGVVAPSAHAVSIKDDVMSITPQVRIQTRAQISDATDVNGDEYRVQGGTNDAANDAIDFSLRRARLGLAFKYGANWKGQFTIMADNVDQSNNTIGTIQNSTTTTTTNNTNRALQIRYAWLERAFAMDDGMSVAVKFGLDKAEQNAQDRLSSSRKLLPNDSASSGYLAPRGVGLGARFNHPMFMIAADLQNNTSALKDSTGLNNEEDEGFYYGLRAEFSFSPDWFIAKRADSFVGKEGHGLNLGLSYGVNADAVLLDVDAVNGGNQAGQQSLSAYGIDMMLWLNGLSAFAEYRAGTTEADRNDNTAVADVDAKFITIQVGYAFPVGDEVLEPAIRYQIIDSNTDDDEQDVNYGNNAETGAAGTQIDIALNYYLSGHDNKLSLAVSLWESEEGEGDATIIRLQHQINF